MNRLIAFIAVVIAAAAPLFAGAQTWKVDKQLNQDFPNQRREVLRSAEITGDARYDLLSRELERDWERAGQYRRTGLAGVEFHATPRPRWDS